MRWTVEDVEKFEAAKQYLDTALIPVFSYHLDQFGVDVVRELKWLEEICVYTERQLTGRLILFPTLYSLQGEFVISPFESKQFPYTIFVTTNQQIYQSLVELNHTAYFLQRKEDEEELVEMVREGKKLTKEILEQWK